MTYNLGRVKPHVKAAAELYGPRFGIKTVYGVGGGSVPNSDHPKGLALDFMTSNKVTGDALANALLADSSVKYVIWWGRINSKDDRGWRTYIGPRNHKDHVHASFNPSGTVSGNALPASSPLVPDSVEKLADFFTNPDTWKTAAMYTGGAIMILVGVILLVGSTPIGKTVRQVAL